MGWGLASTMAGSVVAAAVGDPALGGAAADLVGTTFPGGAAAGCAAGRGAETGAAAAPSLPGLSAAVLPACRTAFLAGGSGSGSAPGSFPPSMEMRRLRGGTSMRDDATPCGVAGLSMGSQYKGGAKGTAAQQAQGRDSAG